MHEFRVFKAMTRVYGLRHGEYSMSADLPANSFFLLTSFLTLFKFISQAKNFFIFHVIRKIYGCLQVDKLPFHAPFFSLKCITQVTQATYLL